MVLVVNDRELETFKGLRRESSYSSNHMYDITDQSSQLCPPHSLRI